LGVSGRGSFKEGLIKLPNIPSAAEQAAALEAKTYLRAKEAAEKVTSWRKGVPQRLKPHCKQGSCGTGKPVPLSKTDFFSTL